MKKYLALWSSILAVLAIGVSGSSFALPSSAVFAYSAPSNCSGASCDVQLSLTTNTGPVTLTATNRGWINDAGGGNGISATNNYIVGLCGTDSCSAGNAVFRNWFAFSLPVGAFATISAATLLLDVPDPAGTPRGVYASWGPVTYTLWDTTGTPPASFLAGTAGLAGFGDLGNGASYGSRAYTAADEGTQPGITLNAAALAYLNANIGNTIILGGAADPLYGQVVVPTLSPLGMLLLAAFVLLAGALTMRKRSIR